jgi:hypothetical protein
MVVSFIGGGNQSIQRKPLTTDLSQKKIKKIVKILN